MSTRIITKCDRCGKEIVEGGYNPPGWGGVQIETHLKNPDANTGAMYRREGFHACDDCIGDLRAFMKAKS